ncbi:DUF2987 domain-containing protein [Shewanella sp. SNU WT4]|uniref:DUF2987 domain-containing protein n=1 Tax=Shewanella sp. SNU WT4 TaxID=2590015 RepID=UPI00112C3953|nr:DUF2987 domain-containing protein [Shewanella sp. SNU WT4]QDF67038.1 DUF2987 domain-containing protein [Shewanella sp. SNU WT4]
MKYPKGCASLCGMLTLLSLSANAAEVSLSYEDFFSRIKQANKADLQLVELTFSVPKTETCVLTSAALVTPTEQFPVTFTGDQRLYLPFDPRLKQDRAVLTLQLAGDAAACGIAVQTREKSVSKEYSQARLTQVYAEMDSLQAQLKGFPMSWFHDPINGIQFSFDGGAQAILNGRNLGEAQQWRFSKAQLDDAQSLSFSIAPSVVSPWVN